MSEELSHHLNVRRLQVEEALRQAVQIGEGCPDTLQDAMNYSLLAPGKRLRPLLAILAAEACGSTVRAALPAACAVEMVHTYSLIHDDLPAMDDDDLRRGLPTCHVKFGEALAILAGDALLTRAFEVLADGYSPTTAAACCRELARGAGASGMVGGQVADLAMESRTKDGTLQELESLHQRKTGALFRASLRMGVLVACGEHPGGPSADLLACFDNYGRAFGLAFQVTDDLLDVASSAEVTGKRVGKDAARGKWTYPGFLGIPESQSRAQRLCQEAHQALASLGDAGQRLRELAQSIVDRDR